MGRKAVLTVVCWLALSQALGDKDIGTQSAAVKENASAESAPRLYRNVPLGVYASAAPYASYSFHLPQFIAAPKTAASQVTPVKQKPVNQNINTYLMDSYGNRFETSQLASYKNAFPQQYVSLQTKLPEHLAQPLVAASPNFQFKQSGPQVFFGAPFRVPALDSPAPTPLHHFPSFGQNLVYADKVQSLAPTSYGYNFGLGTPSAQQHSTNNEHVFANTQSPGQYSNNKNEPKFQRQQESAQIIVGKPKFQNGQETNHAPRGPVKFQRIQESPHVDHSESKYQRVQDLSHAPNDQTTFQRYQGSSYRPHEELKFQRIQEIPHGETKFQRLQDSPGIIHVEHSYDEAPNNQDIKYGQNGQQEAAPATVTYVNNINGKPTVVKVKTDPVPLLDLTLLEPLTFANPLVPQVQHFLPRINQAVYKKLPEADINAAKNYQKEFVVQKTMSYDNDNISVKPQKEVKKKQKKTTQSNKHSKKNNSPKTTSVSHHETLDDAPEIVYEINLPGHKETIKQKAVSYNKQTQSEPVTYSYGSKSEKDPVNYSYSRTSKEPVQDVHYHSNHGGPAHLIYNFDPEEQKDLHVHNSAPHSDSENEKESSDESEDDGPGYHHHHRTEHYKEQPKSSHHHTEYYQERPKSSHHQTEHYKEQPKSSHHHTEHYEERPKTPHHQTEHFKEQPKSSHRETEHYQEQPKSSHHQTEHYQEQPKSSHHQTEHYEKQPKSSHHQTEHYEKQPKSSYHQTEHYEKQPKSSNHQTEHYEKQPKSSHHQTEHYEKQPKSSHHQTELYEKQPKSSHHQTEHYQEQPNSAENQNEPAHKGEEQNGRPNQDNQNESLQAEPPKYSSPPKQHVIQFDFEPMAKQFEEDIRLLTSAQIKVDPSQHVQHPKGDEEQSHTPERHAQDSSPQDDSDSSPVPEIHHHYSGPPSASHNAPAMHIHEKSKRIIIHEEAPDERHMLSEQMKAQVVNHEENSEEDFEKAYKNSAFGFPAYSKEALEAAERDIFDPESYGVPPDNSEYDIENTPFQQYQGDGDYFPKETRENYKDARDKMKENYYTGYAVSKPESLVNRYQNKIDYYKLYQQQKPDYISEGDDSKKTKPKPKFAKYTTAPKFDYPSPKQEKSKSYYGHPKPKQQLYEYDYSKGVPRDNSAFASRPYQRYKTKTNFVEPQFQYGFEPISIPKLLDSELAAMATNDSPESEKPGMRKKVYKENWYIKKTSTSAGAPAS